MTDNHASEIAEIRERHDAFTGRYYTFVSEDAQAIAKCFSAAHRDRATLLAEVGRLTAQLAKCREATVEECAKVALGHKGRAAQERRTKTLKHSYRLMSEEMKLEIQAEERGEDIAAEEIAKAIRALTTGERQ